MTTFSAYDSGGEPLAGLAPVWTTILSATTGVAMAAPTFTDLGEGVYLIDSGLDADSTGIIDLGVTASPRYLHLDALSRSVVAAYDAAGSPLAGLSLTWETYVNAVGTDVAGPSFTDLGGGLYRVNSVDTDLDSGIIDFGATASPRYYSWAYQTLIAEIPVAPAATVGHELDADTIHLYRMDETAPGDYTNIADTSGNGRDFSVAGSVEIIPGPDGVGLARWFTVSAATYASQPGSAEAMALLTGGDWTVEGWVYISSSMPATGYLWNYGAAGESLATNYICGIQVGTAGAIAHFMERASGTNISPGGVNPFAPLDTWCHIAVSREFNGINYDYHYFLDGVLMHTNTAEGAQGGASGTFYLARGEAGSYFVGGLGSQRWSSVARTEVEIAASFAREGKDHENDDDTYLILGMVEEPDLRDANNISHLRLASGTFSPVASLIGGDGGAQLFDAATRYVGSSSQFRAAILDEFTVEFWGQLHFDWLAATTALAGAWVFGTPGSESSSLNFASFDVLPTREARCFSEHGAGINSEFTTTVDAIAEGTEYHLHHYAMTKRTSGANVIYEVYVDGLLIEESDGSHVPYDGGEASQLQIGQGSTLDASGWWRGIMDDMRFSSRRRTAEEIAASYAAGAGLAPPPPEPDVTAPIITNFVPAAATGIESSQVLQFDVTDEAGLAAVVLLASFPSGAIDLIHDNDGFRGAYVGGNNTRTPIVGGYRYRVLRVGGWLETPTIEFIPVDTSGNLGVIP